MTGKKEKQKQKQPVHIISQKTTPHLPPTIPEKKHMKFDGSILTKTFGGWGSFMLLSQIATSFLKSTDVQPTWAMRRWPSWYLGLTGCRLAGSMRSTQATGV